VSKYILPGSEGKRLVGATIAGSPNPEERFQVTLILRHNAVAGSQDRVKPSKKGDLPPAPLTREEFIRQFGARTEDIEAVSKFVAASSVSDRGEARAAHCRTFRQGKGF